jgi:hypothetical protein
LGFGFWDLAALAVVCAISASGCGKKGPPLAPFVHIPAAVEKITAERVGSDVYVKVTVPAQNIDQSTPADIARIDVYGFTGTTPPVPGQFLAQADRLAVIQVAPAPRPGEPPLPPATQSSGALQGSEVTVRDVLTSEQLVPKPPPPPLETGRRRPAPPAPAQTTRPTAPAGPPMPRRFYMAIAFSDRARSSPQGTVADVPLSVVPLSPEAIRLEYTSGMVQLSWEPSGGVLGFILDRTLPIEEAPFDEVPSAQSQQPTAVASDVPAGPTRYNVYRIESADPLALPDRTLVAAWSAPRPVPLNPMPLTALQFSDAAMFDRTQCYMVRALRGTGTALVEGDATPMECVTPIDTFPPAAPTNLTAVSGEGSVSLIWEPNTDIDLGGYLVLRGEAGSDTLQPITDTPIPDARYTDRDVKPGTRYIYAVVAVDDRVPLPNVSAESMRIEETAR